MLQAALLALVIAGPPDPVPWRDIADPADDAVREITIQKEDRGPVWLYTGFLNCWHPDQDIELIKRLKPGHWRHGTWPHWYPRNITVQPRKKWLDQRDSPVYWAKYLETMIALRETGMTWQTILHHKGPHYNKTRYTKADLPAAYEHIHLLVKYARHMGMPFDYWEICNEPGTGPYDGVKGYNFRGTWPEFLDFWDTAYRAVRDAHPEAKIVGPSYGTCNAKSIEPFLKHAASKGQIINVLSWHEISQSPVIFGQDYDGPNIVQPDKAHKNIHEIRTLVETKYPQLGVDEIHIDEWGYTIQATGPGTQMAYFYYFDQAGVDRAAKAHWTQDDLDGILINPTTPRTSYWCWAEYAKQDGGVRLVTKTNDRNVFALASRHDDSKTIHAVVARAKRDSGEHAGQSRPPVKTVVHLDGIALTRAQISIITLGPHDGPLWEEDLEELTTRREASIDGGKLTLSFDKHEENQVFGVTIAPVGTHARQLAAKKQQAALRESSAHLLSGKPLAHVVFREGFEAGYEHFKPVLGRGGWTHATSKTGNTVAVRGDGHSGQWRGQFSENYWAGHDIFQPIDIAPQGAVEATAWFRFPDYEGNENGKGLGAMVIGLHETADADLDRNFIYFKFGTNEQNGYSVVIFNNDGARRVEFTQPSRLTHNVRAKWHQIGVVLDMTGKTLTCRHRDSADKPWQVFYHGKLDRIDWTPKFLRISGFNQAPDWRFFVDDIEVRTGGAGAPSQSDKQRHRAATAAADRAAAQGAIRINCGAALAHIDPQGRAWYADQRFRDGSFGWTNADAGTVDRGDDVNLSPVFRTELWAVKGYRVTAPNGDYNVRLHFAETYGVQRNYDVLLEGKVVLPAMNPLKVAGAKNKGFVREFDVTVDDGALDISFVDNAKSPPMINGIEMIRR